MENLDYLTATYGQQIIECAHQKEKTGEACTKALAILHEQGLFAMFLWLHDAKKEKECAVIGQKLCAMLHDGDFRLLSQEEQALSFFDSAQPQVALNNVREKLTKDLTRMLFVKDLIAQALVYARHRAKAEPGT